MGREERSFDQAYREFLPQEQRREVLKALREKLDPETTFGEIVDAARTLGWEEALGEVLLSELADTLLGKRESDALPGAAVTEDPGPLSGRARDLQAAIVDRLTNWTQEDEQESWEDEELLETEDEDEDELEEAEEEEELEAAPRAKRGRPAKKKASKKKASKKRGAKKKASKKKASKKRGAKKKASKKKASKKRASKKKVSKKKTSKKRASKKKASKKKASKKRASKKKSSQKRGAKKKASKKRGKKSGRR